MQSNIEIIEEFIAAWSSLDAEKLAGYFCADGTYHNMPAKPVSGRDNVQKFIQGFLANWTDTTWDIISIAAVGDTVFCERLDRTTTSLGDVDLPCVGVFEMRDGKIHIWRDYFDMNTFVSAMSPAN